VAGGVRQRRLFKSVRYGALIQRKRLSVDQALHPGKLTFEWENDSIILFTFNCSSLEGTGGCPAFSGNSLAVY
jgi:hypothetical protein